MKIFRPVNPDSRMPSWLQAHTKENFIWQTAMAVLLIGGMNAYNEYKNRKFLKEWEASNPE